MVAAREAANSQEEPEPSPEPKNPAQLYGVLMDIKSFSDFLSCGSVSSTTIACKSSLFHLIHYHPSCLLIVVY